MQSSIPFRFYSSMWRIETFRGNHRVFLSSLSWVVQLSQDVPADAGFLCDKAASLNVKTSKSRCACLHQNSSTGFKYSFECFSSSGFF